MRDKLPETMLLTELTGKRVLIVEDDPLLLELVTTRLDLAGLRTFIARNGVEGVKKAAEIKPDGIVLDINMPMLDGFGVLEQLRESELLRETPTLVLTARNTPDDITHAIRLGAKDYLTKPFNDRQLVQRVGRLLRSRRPQEKPSDGDSAILDF